MAQVKMQLDSKANSETRIVEPGQRKTGANVAPVKNNVEVITVDEMFRRVGEFGKAQKIMVLFLYLFQLTASYQTLSWLFTGYSPKWKCTGIKAECNVTGSFGVGDGFYKSRCSMGRISWDFVESEAYSIVTEWDLVCEKKEYPFITNSVMFTGWMVGAFIIGWFSNKYGRKVALYLSLIVMIATTLGCAFSNHYWLYTTFAFFVGFGQGGIYLLVPVMLSEMVGPKYKNLITGAGRELSITSSICLFCLHAWLIPNWRHLLMVTSAPYLVLLFSYKFMHESVRWQRLNNQLDAAEKTILKISSMNGKPPPMASISLPALSDTGKNGLKDVFKYKGLAMQLLVLCCSWCASSLIIYSISMASDQLGGSIYRDFLLTSLMGFPGCLISKVFGDRFGRKPTFIGAIGMSSLACVGVALVNPNSTYIWARVAAGMFGQLCILIAYTTLYTWSTELLPTVIRSQGMGVVSVAARVGSVAVPWVAQWLQHIHYALPFAVIAGFGFLGSILSFVLPETNKVATLETFEAAARNTRDQKKRQT